jgi:hypothetical protein
MRAFAVPEIFNSASSAFAYAGPLSTFVIFALEPLDLSLELLLHFVKGVSVFFGEALLVPI